MHDVFKTQSAEVNLCHYLEIERLAWEFRCVVTSDDSVEAVVQGGSIEKELFENSINMFK